MLLALFFMSSNINNMHNPHFFVHFIWPDDEISLPLHSFLKDVQKERIIYTL